MLKPLISLAAIFILLIVNELHWRKRKVSHEVSRKLIHISVATFVAFWPYYISYHYIELMALAFFIVVFISRQLKFFKSIHSVKRKTWGDLMFPISMGLVALLTPSKPIFTIAILNMGLVDGMAAVIGEKFGKHNFYKVFKHKKSIAGTLTFIVLSFAILLFCKLFNINVLHNLTWTIIIILPLLAAAAENISPYGVDDLVVPLLVLFVLKWF